MTDALIAALEAEVKKADRRYREERRLRQAADSALVQSMRHPLSKLDHVGEYLYRLEHQPTLEALELENERLRCCGNCKWFRAEDYQNCGHPDVSIHEQGEYYISAPDKCDFTPSRWTAREDKP